MCFFLNLPRWHSYKLSLCMVISDEIEVAMIAIDEAMIVVIPIKFGLVIWWGQRNLPKSVLSEFLFCLLNLFLSWLSSFRHCCCCACLLVVLPHKTWFFSCDNFAWETDDLMENAQLNQCPQLPIQIGSKLRLKKEIPTHLAKGATIARYSLFFSSETLTPFAMPKQYFWLLSWREMHVCFARAWKCPWIPTSFPLDKQFPHFYLPGGHCLLVSVNDLVTR